MSSAHRSLSSVDIVFCSGVESRDNEFQKSIKLYYFCYILKGICGENTATVQNISREQQDAYAINSYKRSAEAWKVIFKYVSLNILLISCIIGEFNYSMVFLIQLPWFGVRLFHWQEQVSMGVQQLSV